MKILDAHHHIWSPESDCHKIGYVWLKQIGVSKPFGDPTPIQRDYELEEFLAENEQIVGSVHVQCDGAIAHPCRETTYVHESAAIMAHPIRIIGFVDLSSHKAEETIVSHLEASSKVCGIRQILSKIDENPSISFAREHYVRAPLWRDQFSFLREYRLSFDLQLYPEQMREVGVFLAKHSDVSVIIDHAGSPYDHTNEGRTLWLEGMRLLSEMEHISVKMSGFGMFYPDGNTNMFSFVMEHLLELFGVSRVMFGSNFPVDKLKRNYHEIVRACEMFLTQDERDQFFHDNAYRLYKF